MTITTDLAPSCTMDQERPRTRLVIEYWSVAMDGQDSCDSCDATLCVLRATAADLGLLAARLGITLHIEPRTVATWDEAVEHHITASPTIRAAGVELRPAHPDGSEVRFWSWRGRTSEAVSAEAVLDLLLRALAAASERVEGYFAGGGPSPYLRQFLTSAAAPAAPPALAEQPAPTGGSCGTGCG